jgi:hypothetical protein
LNGARLAQRVDHPNVLRVVAIDVAEPGVVLLQRAGAFICIVSARLRLLGILGLRRL